jgi:hypothetical protein
VDRTTRLPTEVPPMASYKVTSTVVTPVFQIILMGRAFVLPADTSPCVAKLFPPSNHVRTVTAKILL